MIHMGLMQEGTLLCYWSWICDASLLSFCLALVAEQHRTALFCLSFLRGKEWKSRKDSWDEMEIDLI